MDYIETRKVLLRGAIGFLAITALLAIVSIVSDDFGVWHWNILLSTLSVSCASLGALSCVSFMEKRGAHILGITGIIAAGLAALLVILGIWGQISDDIYWKITVTSILVAIGFAHALLLHLPDLAEEYRWAQGASAVAIMTVVSQFVIAMWLEIEHYAYYQVLLVAFIVDIFLSLLVPIFAKLQGNIPEGNGPQLSETSDKLILRLLTGKTFVDDSGRRFLVVELPADKGETSDG